MDFWAKSNPRETIQEHTDKLRDNIRLLKRLGYIENYHWELLEYAAKYHDMGKMNDKFQKKLSLDPKPYREKGEHQKEVPHAYLSAAMLPIDDLLDKEILDEREIQILVNAVVFHHDRAFMVEEEEKREQMERELEGIKNKISEFSYDIDLGHEFIFPEEYYCSSGITKDEIKDSCKAKGESDRYYRYHILTKGLLHKADYASSADEKIEYPADFLEEAMENYKTKVLGIEDWNDLQKYMLCHKEENVIAVAQTGKGKTEAGLLWIGNHKGFFTLPIRVAINDIYARITQKIVREQIEERVGLNHSETLNEYLRFSEQDKKDSENKLEGLERHYDRTKLMSLPLTLSTLDQLFTFVFGYRGYEYKLATLAYSKIIIDEIQMYTPDLLAYLIVGLKEIADLGGKFAIITATFPPLIEDLLREEGVRFTRSPDFIDTRIRHSVKVKEAAIRAEFIMEEYKKHHKILVICNTIQSAQEIYDGVKESLEECGEYGSVNLLHSAFIKADRKEKEKSILEFGRSNSSDKGIWIGTQVLEASLDIDFDVLITELSDINSFFQRLGRVYRKRALEEERDYNCYLFVGNKEKDIRGIGYVVDRDIFRKSREEMLKLDGKLSEAKKQEIINTVYTTKNLSETDYYKKVKKTMDYIKVQFQNFYSKAEAAKMFRNIASVDIIPLPVYQSKREEINSLIECIKDHKQLAIRRTRAKMDLKSYMLSLQIGRYRETEKTNESCELNRYESIIVYDCEYSFEKGFKNKDREEKKSDEESKFF